MRYVILDPDVIGEFMNGERSSFVVEIPPEPGETLGLKTAHHRKPTALFDVHNVELAAVSPDDGYIVYLKPHVYEHTPRLLAPTGRPRGSELGYTDKPYLSMRDEPEAVDTACLNPDWARTAERRHSKARTDRLEQHREARELLDAEQRLANARQAAQANYVSLREEFRVLRHMQKSGKSTVAQVTRIERIAYREAA